METVKADNRQRVRLPNVKPGQVFILEETREDQVTLTLVKPVERRSGMIGLIKKNGRLMLSEKLDRKEVLAAIRADREGK